MLDSVFIHPLRSPILTPQESTIDQTMYKTSSSRTSAVFKSGGKVSVGDKDWWDESCIARPSVSINRNFRSPEHSNAAWSRGYGISSFGLVHTEKV